jgi:ATP-dependent Clp protease ATP-binding subunit ClpC
LESFAVVEFDQPRDDVVLEMLFRKALYIESKDKVDITYNAVVSAFEYADKYSKERALPGSAVNLLDDTAAAVAMSDKKIVEEEDILGQVEKKIKVAVGEPKTLEKQLLLNLETEIHKRIIGQNEAVSAISEGIRRIRTGLNESKKPISFLFLGPTGVGKTETARVLSNVYFGQEQLIRLDMSEYAGEEGIKRLLGSGPGEGDEKGQLTEAIFDNPYSLVLLDEFEKADNKILDLFLQVFDEGRLTDNKGKTVSFVDSIIIATSNAGSEFIREQVGKGVAVDKTFQKSLLEYLQTQRIFKPELLNRFDGVIVFKPLEMEQIVQIINLSLQDFAKKLSQKDIKLTFDQKVIAKIAREGFDKEFGARPLERYIQNYIEDAMAQKILADEISRGDLVSVSVDSSGNISFVKV